MWTRAKPAANDAFDIRAKLTEAVVAPVTAFKPAYIAPVLVYFAYAAYGITAIGEQFWIKKELKLSPADLAGLSVWLTLPWAVKMVFGELVDTVRIFGSQRRVYVIIGALMSAAGLILLAGAAAGWFTFASKDALYTAAKIIGVIGVVLQDVTADAMSTEVVARTAPDGRPRPEAEVNAELAMVQIIGRLAVSIGTFLIAGLGGWLAQRYANAPHWLFLGALVIPLFSVIGVFLTPEPKAELRPTDWRILGGGLAFGGVVSALGLFEVPRAQEITFVLSFAVIGTMLALVAAKLEPATRSKIFFAALIIFMFRATPTVGDGYRWWTIDVLKFDEAFFGVLAQMTSTLELLSLWLFAVVVARKKVTSVLLWLTIIGAFLALPTLFMLFGGHEWTEAKFGFGARTIAIADSAASSPFGALSMIPLLTLIAIYAPPGLRATWFALMSSFMNLALVGSEIGTKYLNEVFVVDRGQYALLPKLYIWATVIGIAMPLLAILAFRRRVD